MIIFWLELDVLFVFYIKWGFLIISYILSFGCIMYVFFFFIFIISKMDIVFVNDDDGIYNDNNNNDR